MKMYVLNLRTEAKQQNSMILMPIVNYDVGYKWLMLPKMDAKLIRCHIARVQYGDAFALWLYSIEVCV